MKGEYRKAISPITHTKTWWRVGCPYCKTRTRYSFPSQKEASEAFETGKLEKKPAILQRKENVEQFLQGGRSRNDLEQGRLGNTSSLVRPVE